MKMRSGRKAEAPQAALKTTGRRTAAATGGGGGGARATKRTAAKKAPSSVKRNAQPPAEASGSRRRKTAKVIEVDDDADDDEDEDARDGTEDEQSDDEYEVEAIVGHKKGARGAMKYNVKWKNWPESSNTWEDAKNVHCDELIKEYWEKQKAATIGSTSGTSAGARLSAGTPARAARAPVRQSVSPRTPARVAQAPVQQSVSPRTPARVAQAPVRQSVSPRTPGAKTSPMRNDGLRATAALKSPLRGSAQGDEQKNVKESVQAPFFPPPRNRWDGEAVAVRAVEMDTGGLMAEVEWRSGHVTRHAAADLREWAPKKLVDYYQARIYFVEA